MIHLQIADTPMTDGQEGERCSEHWSTELLDRINGQRTDGRHLCDVIISCEDSDAAFPTHRCVLTACSDYFFALFSSALGDYVIRDGVCHVTITTSLLDVSRDVVDMVLRLSIASSSGDGVYGGKNEK